MTKEFFANDRAFMKSPLFLASDEQAGTVKSWLSRAGVQFYQHVYPLPLEQIDAEASLNNQARPEALVDEAVERYTVSLKNGESFPPVVIYFPGAKPDDSLRTLWNRRSRAHVVDGNHRFAAFRRARVPYIPVIILDPRTPAEKILQLTVEANARNGESVSSAWRIRQAEHLISLGFSQTEACRSAAISVTRLKEHRQVVSAEARAKAMKLHAFASLPDGTKAMLARQADDAPFRALSEMVLETGMSQRDLTDFSRKLRDCTSEAERIQAIEEETMRRSMAARAKRATGSKKRGFTSPKHDLSTAAGKLLNVDPQALALSLLYGEEAERVAELMERVAGHAMELMDAARKRGSVLNDEQMEAAS